MRGMWIFKIDWRLFLCHPITSSFHLQISFPQEFYKNFNSLNFLFQSILSNLVFNQQNIYHYGKRR